MKNRILQIRFFIIYFLIANYLNISFMQEKLLFCG